MTWFGRMTSEARAIIVERDLKQGEREMINSLTLARQQTNKAKDAVTQDGSEVIVCQLEIVQLEQWLIIVMYHVDFTSNVCSLDIFCLGSHNRLHIRSSYMCVCVCARVLQVLMFATVLSMKSANSCFF